MSLGLIDEGHGSACKQRVLTVQACGCACVPFLKTLPDWAQRFALGRAVLLGEVRKWSVCLYFEKEKLRVCVCVF